MEGRLSCPVPYSVGYQLPGDSCPCCDSEDGDFEDAYQCTFCGEWRGWEQMSDKDDMCRECYDKALRQLRRYAERQETGDCTAVLNYLLAGI